MAWAAEMQFAQGSTPYAEFDYNPNYRPVNFTLALPARESKACATATHNFGTSTGVPPVHPWDRSQDLIMYRVGPLPRTGQVMPAGNRPGQLQNIPDRGTMWDVRPPSGVREILNDPNDPYARHPAKALNYAIRQAAAAGPEGYRPAGTPLPARHIPAGGTPPEAQYTDGTTFLAPSQAPNNAFANKVVTATATGTATETPTGPAAAGTAAGTGADNGNGNGTKANSGGDKSSDKSVGGKDDDLKWIVGGVLAALLIAGLFSAVTGRLGRK